MIIGWVVHTRYHFLIYATHCWIPVYHSHFWTMKNSEILSYNHIWILFLVILLMTTFLQTVVFLQFWLRQQLMIQGNLIPCTHLSHTILLKCTLYIVIMHWATSNRFNNVDVSIWHSFSGLEFGKVLNGLLKYVIVHALVVPLLSSWKQVWLEGILAKVVTMLNVTKQHMSMLSLWKLLEFQ